MRLKIQVLSSQINSCNDKEAVKPLVEELKKLMENGNDDKLTISFLLGNLSGLASINDRVIVATTNNLDKIPVALLRPGRFDISLNLGRFYSTEIKELLTNLYKNNEGGISDENKRMIVHTNFPAQLIMKSCEYPNIRDMIKYLVKEE